jgi:hypothetical protein
MILNLHRFYDFRFLGVRTKYNMVWLKDKIKCKIFPSVKFFYSKTIELKDGLIRFARFSLIILGVLLVLSLVIFTVTDIVKMFISICTIWKSYFQQISRLI